MLTVFYELENDKMNGISRHWLLDKKWKMLQAKKETKVENVDPIPRQISTSH